MNFLDLIKIEFMKVRRSKIIPLIFIAPLLVVISGVASLSNYFTPEYTNAWPAMFIQSALVYAYYLLPFSMIVIRYQFDSLDGDCQLIYISPDLEEQVLSESASGSVAVQLQAGANYIGITGTDYSGAIQITVG